MKFVVHVDNDLAQPWSPALDYYSSYSLDQLLPTTTRLATILKAAPEAKLKVGYSEAKLKVGYSEAKLLNTLAERL